MGHSPLNFGRVRLQPRKLDQVGLLQELLQQTLMLAGQLTRIANGFQKLFRRQLWGSQVKTILKILPDNLRQFDEVAVNGFALRNGPCRQSI